MNAFYLPVLALIAIVLVQLTSAFTVELLPSEKLCFHEQLAAGERLLIGFQVQDGPNFEVDFTIVDPHQALLKHHIKSSGTEETVEAQVAGKYTYCFHNMLNYPPSKLVSFYTFKDDLEHVNREKGATDPLAQELERLKDGLRAIKEEQQYIIVRERIHRNTAESTNSRVLWWSLFQTSLLVGVCFWQIWYLKRFFEVRRSV